MQKLQVEGRGFQPVIIDVLILSRILFEELIRQFLLFLPSLVYSMTKLQLICFTSRSDFWQVLLTQPSAFISIVTDLFIHFIV